MSHHTLCALRTYRRTWGLSQQELADILGFESRTHVSRIEHGKRTPGIETALACSTLFDVPLCELFPQLATEVDEKIRERISRLQESRFHTTSVLELRKGELFRRALGSIDQPNPAQV